LYINDTQRLYCVCQNVFNVIAPKHLDGTMTEYLGKIHVFLHDFNELLPLASSSSQELSFSCYGQNEKENL